MKKRLAYKRPTAFCSEYSKEVERICEQILVQLGYKCLYRNRKIASIEVDRIFLSPSKEWVIVELKSISQWEFLQFRVSEAQKRRLQLAQKILQSKKQNRLIRLFYGFFQVKTGLFRIYDENGNLLEEFAAKFTD